MLQLLLDAGEVCAETHDRPWLWIAIEAETKLGKGSEAKRAHADPSDWSAQSKFITTRQNPQRATTEKYSVG